MIRPIVMMIMLSVAPVQPRTHSSINSLKEPVASSATVRSLFQTVPQDELIIDAVAAIDADAAFQQGNYSRKLLFQILSGTKNEQGQYSFYHPEQVRQLLTAVVFEERSIRHMILRRIHLVTPEFRDDTVRTLMTVLQSSDFDAVMIALQALARLDDPAMVAGERLKAIVIDPVQALPALQQQFAAMSEEPIRELRARAAVARLYIGAYPQDVELYATLDEQGQIAGGLAILTVFHNREVMLQTPAEGHLRALEHLRKVFADQDRVAAMHPSSVYSFANLIATDDYDAEVRQAARTTLAEIAAVSANPEFRKVVETYLDKFK